MNWQKQMSSAFKFNLAKIIIEESHKQRGLVYLSKFDYVFSLIVPSTCAEADEAIGKDLLPFVSV